MKNNKEINMPVPGSFETITDEIGQVVEKLSFDPCLPVRNAMEAGGRRRNPTDWTYNNVPETYLFDRGYTGHEHLDNFDLINMNGRVYDPWLGRFLSPDPFVQAPTYSQNYNRYSYALNNPLKYVDPNGYTFGPPIDSKLGRGEFAPKGTPFGMGDRGQIKFYFNTFNNRGYTTRYETESVAQYDAEGKFTGYTQETKLVSRNGDGEVVGTVARKGSVESDYAGYILYVKDKNGNFIVYAIEYKNGKQIIVNPGAQGEAFLVPIEESGSAGGGELQPLYGWSVDITIAAAAGYTVEFGEIYDHNTGRTQQFISYGPAFGVEASAGVNAIVIFPKDNFKFSDIEGTSWGMTGSGLFGVISGSLSGNSTPGYSGGTQFDSYYMIKVGVGPGAGFNNTPESNTHFINWIPSRFWW